MSDNESRYQEDPPSSNYRRHPPAISIRGFVDRTSPQTGCNSVNLFFGGSPLTPGVRQVTTWGASAFRNQPEVSPVAISPAAASPSVATALSQTFSTDDSPPDAGFLRGILSDMFVAGNRTVSVTRAVHSSSTCQLPAEVEEPATSQAPGVKMTSWKDQACLAERPSTYSGEPFLNISNCSSLTDDVLQELEIPPDSNDHNSQENNDLCSRGSASTCTTQASTSASQRTLLSWRKLAPEDSEIDRLTEEFPGTRKMTSWADRANLVERPRTYSSEPFLNISNCSSLTEDVLQELSQMSRPPTDEATSELSENTALNVILSTKSPSALASRPPSACARVAFSDLGFERERLAPVAAADSQSRVAYHVSLDVFGEKSEEVVESQSYHEGDELSDPKSSTVLPNRCLVNSYLSRKQGGSDDPATSKNESLQKQPSWSNLTIASGSNASDSFTDEVLRAMDTIWRKINIPEPSPRACSERSSDEDKRFRNPSSRYVGGLSDDETPMWTSPALNQKRQYFGGTAVHSDPYSSAPFVTSSPVSSVADTDDDDENSIEYAPLDDLAVFEEDTVPFVFDQQKVDEGENIIFSSSPDSQAVAQPILIPPSSPISSQQIIPPHQACSISDRRSNERLEVRNFSSSNFEDSNLPDFNELRHPPAPMQRVRHPEMCSTTEECYQSRYRESDICEQVTHYPLPSTAEHSQTRSKDFNFEAFVVNDDRTRNSQICITQESCISEDVPPVDNPSVSSSVVRNNRTGNVYSSVMNSVNPETKAYDVVNTDVYDSNSYLPRIGSGSITGHGKMLASSLELEIPEEKEVFAKKQLSVADHTDCDESDGYNLGLFSTSTHRLTAENVSFPARQVSVLKDDLVSGHQISTASSSTAVQPASVPDSSHFNPISIWHSHEPVEGTDLICFSPQFKKRSWKNTNDVHVSSSASGYIDARPQEHFSESPPVVLSESKVKEGGETGEPYYDMLVVDRDQVCDQPAEDCVPSPPAIGQPQGYPLNQRSSDNTDVSTSREASAQVEVGSSLYHPDDAAVDRDAYTDRPSPDIDPSRPDVTSYFDVGGVPVHSSVAGALSTAGRHLQFCAPLSRSRRDEVTSAALKAGGVRWADLSPEFPHDSCHTAAALGQCFDGQSLQRLADGFSASDLICFDQPLDLTVDSKNVGGRLSHIESRDIGEFPPPCSLSRELPDIFSETDRVTASKLGHDLRKSRATSPDSDDVNHLKTQHFEGESRLEASLEASRGRSSASNSNHDDSGFLNYLLKPNQPAAVLPKLKKRGSDAYVSPTRTEVGVRKPRLVTCSVTRGTINCFNVQNLDDDYPARSSPSPAVPSRPQTPTPAGAVDHQPGASLSRLSPVPSETASSLGYPFPSDLNYRRASGARAMEVESSVLKSTDLVSVLHSRVPQLSQLDMFPCIDSGVGSRTIASTASSAQSAGGFQVPVVHRLPISSGNVALTAGSLVPLNDHRDYPGAGRSMFSSINNGVRASATTCVQSIGTPGPEILRSSALNDRSGVLISLSTSHAAERDRQCRSRAAGALDGVAVLEESDLRLASRCSSAEQLQDVAEPSLWSLQMPSLGHETPSCTTVGIDSVVCLDLGRAPAMFQDLAALPPPPPTYQDEDLIRRSPTPHQDVDMLRHPPPPHQDADMLRHPPPPHQDADMLCRASSPHQDSNLLRHPPSPHQDSNLRRRSTPPHQDNNLLCHPPPLHQDEEVPCHPPSCHQDSNILRCPPLTHQNTDMFRGPSLPHQDAETPHRYAPLRQDSNLVDCSPRVFMDSDTLHRSSVSLQDNNTYRRSSATYQDCEILRLPPPLHQGDTSRRSLKANQGSDTLQSSSTMLQDDDFLRRPLTTYQDSGYSRRSPGTHQDSDSLRRPSTTYQDGDILQSSSTTYQDSGYCRRSPGTHLDSDSLRRPSTTYQDSDILQSSSTTFQDSDYNRRPPRTHQDSDSLRRPSTTYQDGDILQSSSTTVQDSDYNRRPPMTHQDSDMVRHPMPSQQESDAFHHLPALHQEKDLLRRLPPKHQVTASLRHPSAIHQDTVSLRQASAMHQDYDVRHREFNGTVDNRNKSIAVEDETQNWVASQTEEEDNYEFSETERRPLGRATYAEEADSVDDEEYDDEPERYSEDYEDDSTLAVQDEGFTPLNSGFQPRLMSRSRIPQPIFVPSPRSSGGERSSRRGAGAPGPVVSSRYSAISVLSAASPRGLPRSTSTSTVILGTASSQNLLHLPEAASLNRFGSSSCGSLVSPISSRTSFQSSSRRSSTVSRIPVPTTPGSVSDLRQFRTRSPSPSPVASRRRSHSRHRATTSTAALPIRTSTARSGHHGRAAQVRSPSPAIPRDGHQRYHSSSASRQPAAPPRYSHSIEPGSTGSLPSGGLLHQGPVEGRRYRQQEHPRPHHPQQQQHEEPLFSPGRHGRQMSREASSDEDILATASSALSDNTRSKAKLLARRNEFRRQVERGTRPPAFQPHGHRSQAAGRRPLAPTADGGVGAAGSHGTAAAVTDAYSPPPARRAFSQERRRNPPPAAAGRPRHPSNSITRRGEEAALSTMPALVDPGSSRQPANSYSVRHQLLPTASQSQRPAAVPAATAVSSRLPPAVGMTKSRTFGEDLTRSLGGSNATSVFDRNLGTFQNPRAALADAYRKLASTEWEVLVSGLTDIVRLVRYHPAVVLSDLKAVSAAVVQQCRNLRSQVMRAGLQAANEMLQHIGKAMEPELMALVEILLHRTCDTNKFIKADSSRALDTMLECVSAPRAIHCITQAGLTHKHAQVRCTTARLLAQLVQQMGAQRTLCPPPGQLRDVTERLVPAAAQLVREGDLQTRKYAKMIFYVWLDHPDLDKILAKYLSDGVQRDMVKVLDGLHNESKKASAASKGSYGAQNLSRTM